MSDHDEIWRWLAAFADHVRDRDVAAATTQFDPDCVAFGTRADRVSSLDELVEQQWAPIWFNTEDFCFDRRSLVVQSSPDAALHVAIVQWTSVGTEPESPRVDRRGRATIVLNSSRRPGALLATHTHFSNAPAGADQLRPRRSS